MRLERASILENLEQDSGQRTVSPLRIVAGMGGGQQEQGKHLGLVLSLSLFGPGPQHFAGPGTLGKSLKVLWTLALPSVKWDCSPPHRAALTLL